MKTTDRSILNELDNINGYDTALLTTYNFETSFFEKYILSLLAKHQVRIINLFVDAKQLNKALRTDNSFSLGKNYYVTPILMNGSFHPKAILLLGEKRAKLIISSANIKISGFIQNNEIFNSFEYTEKNTKYANLISSAITFFKSLYNVSINKDKDVLQKLNEFSVITEENDSISLLFNTEISILEQLSEHIHDAVREINIAVPFYDPCLEALQEIRKRFNCHSINLYIQNKKNTFPIEYNNKYNIVPEDRINLFEAVLQGRNKSKMFYHGKVIEFVTDTNSYILYGSSNCSSSALLKTYQHFGNIECDVLYRSAVKANYEFFHTFIKGDNTVFENGFLIDEKTSDFSEYSFAYGAKTSDSIMLYLLYKDCIRRFSGAAIAEFPEPL